MYNMSYTYSSKDNLPFKRKFISRARCPTKDAMAELAE